MSAYFVVFLLFNVNKKMNNETGVQSLKRKLSDFCIFRKYMYNFFPFGKGGKEKRKKKEKELD